jgi:hypothetical protein
VTDTYTTILVQHFGVLKEMKIRFVVFWIVMLLCSDVVGYNFHSEDGSSMVSDTLVSYNNVTTLKTRI